MNAIYINCKGIPFVKLIMSRDKVFETRNKNTLHRFLGERVLIAESGHGKPVVRCSAIISEIIEIFNQADWEAVRSATMVPPGSKYDWNENTRKKVLYRLTDVQEVAPFVPVGIRHGRTSIEIEEVIA